MKNLLKAFIFFSTLMNSAAGLASHFKGGELVYLYQGSSEYIIRANTYWTQNCSITFTHSATLTTHYQVVTAFAKVSDTTANGTQECIFEQRVKYVATVNDTISFSSSARISGGANFTASAFGLSTLIKYDHSDPTKSTSSPLFGSKPFYNFPSTDGALTFSLNASLPADNTDSTWAKRQFSLSTPVGVTGPYASMSGLSINAISGDVTWTLPTVGIWLVNVKVEELDNSNNTTGAFIFRDFMLTVVNTTSTSKHKPTFASFAPSALAGVTTATYTLNVAASDVDVGETVTLTANGLPLANGATFTQTAATATTSSAVGSTTGTFSWPTPPAGFYAMQFTATDSNNPSFFTQLNVTIGINVPVAYNTTATTIPANGPLSGTLGAIEPNGLTLTYTIDVQPLHGTVSVDANTGVYTYTPTAGYQGSDYFGFKAYNGTTLSNLGTVTIAVNTPPTANAGTDTSGTINTAIALSGTGADTEATVTYSWAVTTKPSGSTATLANSTTTTPTITANTVGTYIVTFTVSDGVAATTDTVSVTVNPLNTAPTLATNTGSSMQYGATETITNTKLNVTDTQQTTASLTYTLTTPPRNGAIRKNGNALTTNSTFTQDDINNSLLTYVNSTYTNADTFYFTVSDGAGGTIGSTAYTVNVANVPSVADSLYLGELVSCLMDLSGQTQCWGDANDSKIPGAAAATYTAPTAASFPGISKLSIGRRHGCMLLTNGKINCFGEGAAGQLGMGSQPASSSGIVTVAGFGS